MRFRTLSPAYLIGVALPAIAQQPTPDAVKIADVTVSGWLRTRGEAWNWFEAKANNEYAFSESIFRLSFSEQREKFDWKLEFGVPVLLGIPNNTIAPGAQGQLGFGGSYFAANSRSAEAAMIFPKQAYLRLKLAQGAVKQTLQLGRSEFFEGAEVTPKNGTLAALKRDRIAQRLLGNFGFSDVGRSFDGVTYVAEGSRRNLTFFGARPTRGVFQVDGWGEVNTNVFYGAFTQQVGQGTNAGEWRVFGLGYSDYRDGVLKTDNRPQAVRAFDHAHSDIATVGAHYIHSVETSTGTLDFLIWGVLQGGSWGTLAQRADAFAVEAGWQPPVLRRVKPWFRGGYDYGSGDKNPNDSVHGTFFQVLPTARVYARFPFFNMMNNRDAFGELILRPSEALTVRTDLHSLALANKNDLWYSRGRCLSAVDVRLHGPALKRTCESRDTL